MSSSVFRGSSNQYSRSRGAISRRMIASYHSIPSSSSVPCGQKKLWPTSKSPSLHPRVQALIPIDQQDLNHIVSEYLAHYHDERPHQGLGKCQSAEE